VIFLSDNGGCAENVMPGWYDVPNKTRDGRTVHVGNDPKFMPGPQEVYQSYGPAWANASNSPFRRFKHWTEEGGISTPFIVRWPGHVKAGQTREEMVLNVDAAPTLLEIAGLPRSPTMQGRSFAPLAEGRALPDWRKDWLYEYYEYPGYENVKPNRGVRTERYKLIHYFTEPEEFELYDLKTDPGEDRNLYGRPEVADLTARLKARLEALRKETGDAYVYKRSRNPRMSILFDPPNTEPAPWRPQSH